MDADHLEYALIIRFALRQFFKRFAFAFACVQFCGIGLLFCGETTWAVLRGLEKGSIPRLAKLSSICGPRTEPRSFKLVPNFQIQDSAETFFLKNERLQDFFFAELLGLPRLSFSQELSELSRNLFMKRYLTERKSLADCTRRLSWLIFGWLSKANYLNGKLSNSLSRLELQRDKQSELFPCFKRSLLIFQS